MKKAVDEMRTAIVRYYENKGYSHSHAETYVPHDAEKVRWIYNKIQEEKRNEPTGSH